MSGLFWSGLFRSFDNNFGQKMAPSTNSAWIEHVEKIMAQITPYIQSH